MPAVTRRQYKGAAAQTTITNALASGDTTISIAAATGFPSTAAVPFFVVISPGSASEEKCLATIVGTTLTLTRAQDDTTAQSHSSGAAIYPVFSADDADEANKLASTLTTRGDLLTMGAGPDFARIAIGTNGQVLTSNGTDAAFGTVVAAGLATDSVTTAKIVDANVTGPKLANAAINDQTASYTAVVGDRNKRIVMNVATANTVTINDTVFATGDTIFVANKGAGATTVTAGAGVTINTAGSLVIAQHGGGTLVATSASVFTFFSGGGAANPSTLEFLVIAGGGSGGYSAGGGGGAGGYRNSVSGESQGGLGTLDTPFAVSAGVTYTITVGAGGAARTSGAVGADGTASSIAGSNITTITSTGGGGGGSRDVNAAGNNGGSGGGGGGNDTTQTAGTGTANQGFDGSAGRGGGAASSGGGGGGAGAVGGVTPAHAGPGGAGGNGLASSITGSSVTRAGGGGGGGHGSPASAGGSGGGGTGGAANNSGTSATVNTGSGGGGAGSGTPTTSGAGGKGVVIIRQAAGSKLPTTLTGGVATIQGQFIVYTFNDSGTIAYTA